MPSRLTVVLVSLLLATPPLIFWLWLVTLPARVAMLCPEKCKCDIGGYWVDCSSASLNAVPLIYFTNVRELNLFNNNITLLKKDSFVSLTELDLLYIDRCGLREIDFGAFNGLVKLTGLSLGDNSLRHLDSEVFSGLVNLKYIDLKMNELQYLHPDTFLRLPNLQKLFLFLNSDIQIPTDRNFIYSHSLSFLGLSGCNVSAVSVETFANVSALIWLDLSYNFLTTVHINMLRALPKLSVLYLDYNPLHCDCQVHEVWRWCKDRRIETQSDWFDGPQCATPREVRGIWWDVLENGQCLEGNIQYGDYNREKYRYINTENYYYHKYKYSYESYVKSTKHYQVPLYAFPFIFGTISNVILLIIIMFNKDMRTVPNMYILNLAASDMIYLTVLFSEACANRISDAWLDGEVTCSCLPFCRRIAVGL
jgi:hypothetical protein